MIMPYELDQNEEMITTSRAALPLRNVTTVTLSEESDALMDRWFNGRKDEVCLFVGRKQCNATEWVGVDVWYTPARTAPVRLLVEAEASPAFLRRARV